MLINQNKLYNVFFNGDADGICAVLQFIHSGFTIESFFTGHKRDQTLLRYGTKLLNTNILVFDIELARNINSMKQVLNNGCKVTWFDHHGDGEENIFSKYENFYPNIDVSPNINTALIVYNFLNNPELLKWAIVGLFGDNIDNIALSYCQSLNLSAEEISTFSEMGKLINYNSYGEDLSDLILDPVAIINQAKYFIDPVSFYKETGIGQLLKQFSAEDLALALACYKEEKNMVFLPNLPWAKRVYGTLGNFLAKKNSSKPFVIFVDIGADNYLVSVRAPLNQPTGAGDLCRLFYSGGGRAQAGGINCLHKSHLEKFTQAFQANWLS